MDNQLPRLGYRGRYAAKTMVYEDYVKIETDEFGDWLLIDGKEFGSPDGQVFEVLASALKGARLSDLPKGRKIVLCDRVVGSRELYHRSPHCEFENSPESGLIGHGEIPFFAPSEDIEIDALEHHFKTSIAAGRRALDVLNNDDRLLAVHHSIYDEIAYLTYSVRLFDQLIEDAEAYMAGIDSRVQDGLERPSLFICHASEDKPFVERLVHELDRRALYAWFDKREILVGDSIVAKVNEGLQNATFVVAVLSSNSVRKPWVVKELGSTLMRQLADAHVMILPVLIEDCELPAILADVKYANFKTSFEDGLHELVSAVRER